MKKMNNGSSQFKFIQVYPNEIENQFHKNNPIPNKKKISKDRQEFINNISASGFKQIHRI